MATSNGPLKIARAGFAVAVGLGLLLGASPAAADGESPAPKSLSELIRDCEARLAGRGGVIKPTPKAGDKEPSEKTPVVSSDKRPLAERTAEAKKLALKLVHDELKGDGAAEIVKLRSLAVPDIALWLGPLMTGGGHDKKKVRVAYTLLAHYVPEVYSGQPTAQRMAPFGETHNKYRAWCAKRMKADSAIMRFVRSRDNEAMNQARSLANAREEAVAKSLKQKLFKAGEERVAEATFKILYQRSNMSEKDIRASLFVGKAADEVFQFYSGIDLDKMREEARKKGRGRGRDGALALWRRVLLQGSQQLMAKARDSEYIKLLMRR